MAAPLIVTGTARSGTTLVAQMLGAHPAVAVASDPFLPVFRALRDAMVDRAATPLPLPEGAALQDGYFDEVARDSLDAVLDGTLDLPIDPAQWPVLLQATLERAGHESADLLEVLPDLRHGTYAELLESAVEHISRARGPGERAIAGFKDVWICDFVPAIARALPDARFVYVQRDPRGVIASALAGFRRGDAAAPHLLSYLRHWRKGTALVHHFGRDAALAPRLLVTGYEDLVADPIAAAARLCEFLGLDADPAMTDPSRFVGYPSHAPEGLPWTANTSFPDETRHGFDAGSSARWRSVLSAEERALADLVCGPDLRLAAGSSRPDDEEQPDVAAARRAAVDNGARPDLSWRSDTADAETEIEREVARHRLLATDRSAADRDTVRRCFLFEDVFEALRDASRDGAVE